MEPRPPDPGAAPAVRQLLVGALLLCLAAGCGSPRTGPPAEPPTTCPIPLVVAAPTFSGDILPALQQSCGSSATSCHGGAAPTGHVEYSTDLTRNASDVWADLVNADPSNAPPGVGWKRIAPNDVARSWLIEKITQDDPGGAGSAYGARMPYGAPDVCGATVQSIENWIDRGAPDD